MQNFTNVPGHHPFWDAACRYRQIGFGYSMKYSRQDGLINKGHQFSDVDRVSREAIRTVGKMEGPMKESRRECLDLLHALNEIVAEASAFFLKVDQDLFDGHQNAGEILSHLVFWHREYALIIKALKDGQQPRLGRYVC